MRRTIAAIAVLGLLACARGESQSSIAPAALAARIEAGSAPRILDVRSPEEFASGHVPGAVNVPHDQLASRLAEVPKDKDVVIYCRSGRRTGLAAELLAANGYSRLGHLEGDMLAWQEKQRPMEVPRDPAACAAALKEGVPAKEACAAQ
jgi:rhodanese-related sulfurtransferase